VTKKKGQSVGQSIGGIIVGFDQQIFRTTPPVNELVAKGTPLRAQAASGGGTLTVGVPDPAVDPERLELTAPGVGVIVDLVAGGRLASLVVDGRELLKTEGDGPITWGSFPMAPFAGRVRDASLTFAGDTHALRPTLPPHAIHGTVLGRRWRVVGEATIATDLGSDWPFAGYVIQRFELGSDHLTCRLELHAEEPMPASIGWHPYFARRPDGVAGALELDLDAGAMYVRDAAGIATDMRIEPPPGPWDDCFTDLRRPPVLRWPGFLELTIESDCPDWVVYTAPLDALCVEPQTAPPDAVNTDPTIVLPGRPLIAEMTWRWRSLAG
jgi:aldose 1-epimerase